MAQKIIRWGILGTSYISGVMAKAIQESASSELVAISSRSSDSAKKFATEFAVPKFYVDYQSLLADADIDAVYIGLPNHLHKEWMLHCAAAGKHILCEKPLVLNRQEAEEVFFAVKKAEVFCMEALMYRCHPFTQMLQNLIQDKIIGDVKLFNAIYSADIAAIANPTAGGSIRNLGCYPVSLVRLLANAEPINIIGLGRKNLHTLNDSQASVILEFPNQLFATISTADDIKMHWQFDVFGTQGHLKVVTNPWLPSQDNNKIIVYEQGEKEPREITVTATQSLYSYQIDLVNTHILNKKVTTDQAGISWQDSLGNLTVLEKWINQITM